MADFVTKACPNCPFKKDVKPFIRMARAEDLAYNAQNPFNSFPCHCTTTSDPDSEDGGGWVDQHKEKQCAGHLTVQHHENGGTWYDGEGFEPDPNCFESAFDMIEHYEHYFETEGEF